MEKQEVIITARQGEEVETLRCSRVEHIHDAPLGVLVQVHRQIGKELRQVGHSRDAPRRVRAQARRLTKEEPHPQAEEPIQLGGRP